MTCEKRSITALNGQKHKKMSSACKIFLNDRFSCGLGCFRTHAYEGLVTPSVTTHHARRKIKHRASEKRLNPYLIYMSKLEQMRVELKDDRMDAHRGAGNSYEFCTKSGVTLRYDVQKAIHCRAKRSKIQKNHRCAKSSKIIMFRAGSGAATFTLAKRWSHQVQLRDARADKLN